MVLETSALGCGRPRGVAGQAHFLLVLRSDGGPARPRLTFTLNGAAEVSGQALASGRLSPFVPGIVIDAENG